MKPSGIIAAARRILNDEDADLQRASDPELLGYVNDYIKQLVRTMPSLLIETREITLVEGELQSLDRLTTNGLTDVLKNEAGRYVRRIDLDALEAQFGTWRSETAGPSVEWAPLRGDPWGFIVYPPAVDGAKLHVRLTPVPGTFALADDLPVADHFEPSAAHYVAARALTKNTNMADTQRGQALMVTASVMAGVSEPQS